MLVATANIYLKNQEETEGELRRIDDAIHCLLEARVLLVPEDIEVETLQARIGGYITELIKIGVRA